MKALCRGRGGAAGPDAGAPSSGHRVAIYTRHAGDCKSSTAGSGVSLRPPARHATPYLASPRPNVQAAINPQLCVTGADM